MFEIMDEINKVTLTAPVEVGQVVIHDVCHTGVDVIATKRLEKIA
jgi:CxxC motif-containing protein